MAYLEFKSLSSRTASDEILGNKAFNIARSMVDSEVVFLQWFTSFLIKKSVTHTGTRIVCEEVPENQKLAKK